MSMRRTIGSSMPRGRSPRTRVTASFTSLSARSVSVPNRKVIVVLETPSVIDDLRWWAPATLATASSTFLVTCPSSSPGDAPNCDTRTDMRGTSTFGILVIGSLVKLIHPSATSATAKTMGGVGFRIDHAEILSAIGALPSISLGAESRLEPTAVARRSFDSARPWPLRGAATAGTEPAT